MEREIGLIWNKSAINKLARELKRISEISISQAEQVEQGILSSLEGLFEYPERYPLDKYKVANNGNFRAFETHSFRVSYKYTKWEIRVLRIRHVKQCPKEY